MSQLITGKCYDCRFAEEDRCEPFDELMHLSGGEMTITVSGCCRYRRSKSAINQGERVK